MRVFVRLIAAYCAFTSYIISSYKYFHSCIILLPCSRFWPYSFYISAPVDKIEAEVHCKARKSKIMQDKGFLVVEKILIGNCIPIGFAFKDLQFCLVNMRISQKSLPICGILHVQPKII